MSFWNNPENNSVKIILAVLVFILVAFFVYKNMNSQSLKNTGQVAPGTSVRMRTDTASAITKTSAILRGTVLDAGITTSRTVGTPVQFDYGTTQKYGMTAYAGSAVTGQSFYAPVTGLTCGTTYHFRSRASMFASAAVGSNLQFTTLGCNTPDVKVVSGSVTTSAPNAITASTATLNGKVTDLGNAGGAMGGFEYGKTTTYGTKVTAAQLWGPGTFSLPIKDLACATTYHVRATVVNSAGTGNGADTTFTTTACPSGPLAIVTTGKASIVNGVGVTLNGMTVNNQGWSYGTSGFQYGTTTSYGTEVVARNFAGPGPFSTVINKGFTRGTTYHFRAFVRNATTGQTAYGADVTFTF